MNDNQLEDRIRTAIRVIADEPAFAPPPQRIPVSKPRPRHVFERWAPAVAALAVAAITAVIVTIPSPWSVSPGPVVPAEPKLPGHVPALSTQIPKLSESPLGRPALAVVYQGAASAEPGGAQAVLVAEDGLAYRRIDLAEQRGAVNEMQRWSNAITLLSPSGEKVAVGDGRGGATDIVIVNIVTGERQVIPLAKPSYYRLLAWAPDGGWVVLAMRDEPRRTGDAVVWRDKNDFRLVVLDVATGAMAPIGETTSTVVVTAHFSLPLGLVIAEPERLRFFDVTPGPKVSLVRTIPQPGGGDFVGWSADQSLLVFVNAKADGTLVWFRNVTDDSNPYGPVYLADRFASFVGWRSPDEIILYSKNELIGLSIPTGKTTTLAVFDDPNAIGARIAARLIYTDRVLTFEWRDPATADWRTHWATWASGAVLLILLAGLLLYRRLRLRGSAGQR